IRLRPGQLFLCTAELYPLRPNPQGYPCSLSTSSLSLFTAPHRLTVRRMFREVFTRVSGLAADGVREVDLYLASGRVIPVALRDNVYTVEAPSDQFPAKVVAFDGKRHAVDVQLIDFQSRRTVVAPCPAAALTALAPARLAK